MSAWFVLFGLGVLWYGTGVLSGAEGVWFWPGLCAGPLLFEMGFLWNGPIVLRVVRRRRDGR